MNAKQTPTIAATLRERTGSRYSQRLRNEGKLPIVIYGHKKQPDHLIVQTKEMVELVRSGSRLFSVDAAGTKQMCILKAVQYDYLGDDILHVDFARVDLTEKIELNLPVTFVGEGECPGLKEAGAFLDVSLNTLDVLCRADAIPESIVVDLSETEGGQAITVGSLQLPDGVETHHAPNAVVGVIHLSKAAVSDADGEGEGEGEVEGDAADASAEPEVINKPKDEEG